MKQRIEGNHPRLKSRNMLCKGFCERRTYGRSAPPPTEVFSFISMLSPGGRRKWFQKTPWQKEQGHHQSPGYLRMSQRVGVFQTGNANVYADKLRRLYQLVLLHNELPQIEIGTNNSQLSHSGICGLVWALSWTVFLVSARFRVHSVCSQWLGWPGPGWSRMASDGTTNFSCTLSPIL